MRAVVKKLKKLGVRWGTARAFIGAETWELTVNMLGGGSSVLRLSLPNT